MLGLKRSVTKRWLYLNCAIGLATPATLSAQQADSTSVAVADRHGATTYSSISDGQPGTAGSFQAEIAGGWSELADVVFQTTVGYTLSGAGMLSNMTLSATVPTLNVGESDIDFERSVSFSWQQRWLYGLIGRPSFSTLISIEVPYDEPGETMDLVVAGIANQAIGAGVGYVNAYAETHGRDLADVEFGALIGYKHPLASNVFLYGDVLYESGRIVISEVAFEFQTNGGISIGPGGSIDLDVEGNDLFFGAGLLVFYNF